MKQHRNRNIAFIAVCCAILAACSLAQPAWASRAVKGQTFFYRAKTSLVVHPDNYSPETLDLSISAKLAVTRPTGTLSTTYKSYYITGTSDPSTALTCNGKSVERPGTKGTFGVYVELNMGANTFTFKQGDITKSVTITRTSPAGVAKISEIKQDSMLPALHAGVKVGEPLPLYCIAPSGSSVSATFGGQKSELKQIAVANNGIPAVFKGELIVKGNYDPDVTAKIGPVTYTMTYNGSTKSYKSSGNVYVAGENSRIAVQVTSFTGFVYPDVSKLGAFKELLKKDATDYVVNHLVSGDKRYFEIKSGGFIPNDQVKIIEGRVNISNTISEISSSFKSKSESYSFSGTASPAYDINQTESSLVFTMYNTTGSENPPVSDSRLFSSVSRSGENAALTYTFSRKENTIIWGYSVTFNDGITTLTVNYKPRLSTDTNKPFEGLRILLDPGHGGTDPGALGVAGMNGPDEAVINLAHAYAVRDELVAKGATVYLTRDSGVYKSLDARLEGIEASNVDLFISLHHNSVGVDTDAGKPSGVEVYYHTASSRSFASNMLNNITSATGRTKRKYNQSYYRVTLLPQCPSLLLELGFMSNPAEYETLTNAKQIALVAKGISNGILVTLK